MSAAFESVGGLLCVGEALVDLIGEEWTGSVAAVRRFTPHLGGTVANVAVAAARAGAPVALAGGAGDDEWGRWVRDRLLAEGVEVSHFRLLPGVATQLAFVSVAHGGEPTYTLYGPPVQSVVHCLGSEDAERGVSEALAEGDGLLISSNTLAEAPERAATLRIREAALERGRPVVFDCNLRLHRWASPADAAAAANACVPGTALVRANRGEAELMTGERDPERAARALCRAGARLVVISLGSAGAILRGAQRADVAAVPAQVRSTIGAGDAFTGVLAARLAQSGFDPAAAAAAMGDAAAAAARACERWGAHD